MDLGGKQAFTLRQYYQPHMTDGEYEVQGGESLAKVTELEPTRDRPFPSSFTFSQYIQI